MGPAEEVTTITPSKHFNQRLAGTIIALKPENSDYTLSVWLGHDELIEKVEKQQKRTNLVGGAQI